jgi:tetratricopeptide (TPR) repeat protein
MNTEALANEIDAAYEAIYDDRLNDAKAALDRARRVNAKAPEVRLLEIDVLDAEGLSEEAITAAEEALQALPKSMLLKLKLATLILDVYDDVQEARPHLEELWTRIAKGEKPDVQAPDAESAEAVDDFVVEVLLTLSDARAADHDPRGALQSAEEAQKRAKDEPMALVAVAAAQFDLCKLDDAEKTVALAIDKDPRCADAYWLRGRILTYKGDHAAADKAFSRAVGLDDTRFN